MHPTATLRALAPSLLLAAPLLVSAQEFTTEVYDFLTRPDIEVPRLVVDAYDPTQVAPGYIFSTPWAPEIAFGVNYKFGPIIYDNDGELVWTGYDRQAPKRDASMGFFVLDFEGEPHIGYPKVEFPGQVHGYILDKHYNLVQNVTLGGTDSNPLWEIGRDMHEYNVITPSTMAVTPAESVEDRESWVRPEDPPTAILTSTNIKPVDRTIVCGSKIDWIRDFPFQEISLDGKNTVVFEWNPVDHIPVNETSMCPGMMDHPKIDHELRGSDSWRPFDYVHRNAIDKLPDGNFIVSARHMNTIYKISSVDGHIMWRLGGGRITDFNQTSIVPGVPLEFGFQHDARVANDLPGADPANRIYGITLWDNANARYGGIGATSDSSRGKSIIVNENTMEATLVSAFALPGNLLGTNQGAHQSLPNGNHIIGGGNIAEIIEYSTGHDSDDLLPFEKRSQQVLGQEKQRPPVFAAHFGGGPMNSYRARRYEWHAYPKWTPDIFAYRQSCSIDNDTYVYASWNGATEVATWKVYGAAHEGAADEEFRELATAGREGFETTIPVVHYDAQDVLHVYAVAHDQSGEELGRTDKIAVWVPREEDVQVSTRDSDTFNRRKEARRKRLGECTEKRCAHGFSYSEERARQCELAPEPAS